MTLAEAARLLTEWATVSPAWDAKSLEALNVILDAAWKWQQAQEAK
jgi:hypothetical protein